MEWLQGAASSKSSCKARSWESSRPPRKPTCRFHRSLTLAVCLQTILFTIFGYGSIPINTIFRGMNIHLPLYVLTHCHFTICFGFLFTALCNFLYLPVLYLLATATAAGSLQTGRDSVLYNGRLETCPLPKARRERGSGFAVAYSVKILKTLTRSGPT